MTEEIERIQKDYDAALETVTTSNWQNKEQVLKALVQREQDELSRAKSDSVPPEERVKINKAVDFTLWLIKRGLSPEEVAKVVEETVFE